MAQQLKGLVHHLNSIPTIHLGPLPLLEAKSWKLTLTWLLPVFVNSPGKSPDGNSVGSSGGLLRQSRQGQGTHQEEGTHSRDLVELHQQAQGLLMVAAVFLVHTELVLLQDMAQM